MKSPSFPRLYRELQSKVNPKTTSTYWCILSIFSNAYVVPHIAVLRVVEEIPAAGSTSMAAALWPYYEQRIPLDLILLVSDEGENRACHQFMLTPLFQAYVKDVSHRAKVCSLKRLSHTCIN